LVKFFLGKTQALAVSSDSFLVCVVSKVVVMERSQEDDFSVERKIGGGEFGEVFLARHARTGQLVALKRMWKNSRTTIKIRESFFQEVKASKILQNDCGVVRLLEYLETEKYFLLVTEYFDGMELFKLLETRKFQPLAEEGAKSIFGQILDTILNAHRKGMTHMDIKLDNILIDRNKRTKIIDWGLCVTESPEKCIKFCGSLEYAAPEIWSRPSNSTTYSAYKADVFSLGVVLYALLVGRFPFSMSALDLMRKGQPVPIPLEDKTTIGDNCKQLLRGMLEANPAKRLSLLEVQNHAWFQSSDDIA